MIQSPTPVTFCGLGIDGYSEFRHNMHSVNSRDAAARVSSRPPRLRPVAQAAALAFAFLSLLQYAQLVFGFDTQPPRVLSGDLSAVYTSMLSGPDTTTYYLHVHEGVEAGIYQLDFCPDVKLDDVILGAPATIVYDDIVGGVIRSCRRPQQPQWQQQREQRGWTGRRRALFDKPTIPSNVGYLVYLVTLCGYKQPADLDANMIHSLLKGTGDQLGRNMKDYYETCSYGTATLRDVAVVGPLEIPCRGTVNLGFQFPDSNNFNTSFCGFNMYKWMYYMDEQAIKQGINPQDYHHRVLILPRNFSSNLNGCPQAAGMATIGFWDRKTTAVNTVGSGFIWLPTESHSRLELWMHEAGHNYNMAHANITGGCGELFGDQCDPTCTMGAVGGQGIRCFNAPHMWQAGWGRPFQWYNDADLGYGKIIALELPNQMSSPSSFVAIALSGLSSVLYLSVRINTPPFDLPFEESENGVPFVLLHSYRGTPANAYLRTTLLGKGELGKDIIEAASGLLVRFAKWIIPAGAGNDTTGGTASVIMCRRRSTIEQTCGDGLDDDCDFVPDEADEDCIGRLPSSTPVLRRPGAAAGVAAPPPGRSPQGRPAAMTHSEPTNPTQARQPRHVPWSKPVGPSPSPSQRPSTLPQRSPSPPPSKAALQSPPPSKAALRSPPPSKAALWSPPPSKAALQSPPPSKAALRSPPPAIRSFTPPKGTLVPTPPSNTPGILNLRRSPPPREALQLI